MNEAIAVRHCRGVVIRTIGEAFDARQSRLATWMHIRKIDLSKVRESYRLKENGVFRMRIIHHGGVHDFRMRQISIELTLEIMQKAQHMTHLVRGGPS